MPDDLPERAFATRADLWQWLERHHADAPGLWLRLAKKGSGIESVSYDEAVEVALCFGWIDGQIRGRDEATYLQRFTPRRPRSPWSKSNVDRVERLLTSGEMRAAGLREVERAKADGRWDAAYDGSRTASVPDDLRAALDAHPAAAEFFATISAANRYAILYRLQTAKRPETRARRIEKFVQMLAEGRTIY